ncbi:iron uptake porin [Gloeobacter kilaueensis]|uniref:iron uptake porin n=1 Tax=Gloeobacter kilaueensis TaxID=1416614 RepID=UPI001183C49C|nr:iron uptake porin [Gloeobacter kilaueensis]
MKSSVCAAMAALLVAVNQAAAGAQTVPAADSLQDVQPGQWAYGALQHLIETYRADNADLERAFDSHEPLTRYEFAVGLNQVLGRMNGELSGGKEVTRADLEAVSRLQQEYRPMLASMEGRIEALETRIARLQAESFSPIVKMSGAVYVGLSAGTAARDLSPTPLNRSGAFEEEYGLDNPDYGSEDGSTAARRSSGQVPLSLAVRTDFKLTASFTGRDLLEILIRGEAGSSATSAYGGGRIFNFAGSNTDLSGEPGNPTPSVLARVAIDEFYYNFPIGSGDVRLIVGPRLEPREFIGRSAIADINATAFLRHSFQSNPLEFLPRGEEKGSGAALDWYASESLSVRAAYMALKGGQNRAEGGPFAGGLFGGDNQFLAEVEFRPADNLTLQLLYNRASRNGGFGATGTVLDEVPETFANLITGGAPGVANALALSVDWQISNDVGINGRLGYGLVTNGGQAGDARISSWSTALVIGRVFGSVADRIGVAIGQPIHIYAPGAGLLADTGTQTNFELFYQYALSDRITIKPDLQLISQPGNVYTNPLLTVGSVVGILRF